MQSSIKQDNLSPSAFDFVALSLARMHAQGQEVNVEQVAGSMDAACRSRFLSNYRNHLRQFTGQV